MLAKIVIPFRDGGRRVAVGEVIPVKGEGAAFLFRSGYAVPADDEAVAWCRERKYVKDSNLPAAGS